MRKYETLGRWHDSWASLVLSAPDRFREIRSNALFINQKKALRDAFDDIRANFDFARRKLKDERLIRIAEELIEMSLEAYLAGDSKKGAHALQECEGMIWTVALSIRGHFR